LKASILDDMPDFQARLGYVPEEPHLYSHLSAASIFSLPEGCAEWAARAGREDERVPATFSLWDDQHCPSILFKGMRRRSDLGRAASQSAGADLDEPLSAWTEYGDGAEGSDAGFRSQRAHRSFTARMFWRWLKNLFTGY